MRASAFRAFRALGREAVGDGVRRRIVPVVAVISLLSLMAVDSCTSCGAPSITRDGQSVELSDVAGWTGMVIFAVLALWTLVLAGILGSDHLAETLEDGSANLVLARPVSRDVFALARLFGVLAIAWIAGAILLGVTGAFLHARQDVDPSGALAAGLAAGGGAVVVASLAMAASLVLPRIGTVLAVIAGVWGIGLVNAIGLAGTELGGIVHVLDRYGPPLLSSVAVGLRGWIEPVELRAQAPEVALRLTLWIIASVGLLLAAFRRRELGR